MIQPDDIFERNVFGAFNAVGAAVNAFLRGVLQISERDRQNAVS